MLDVLFDNGSLLVINKPSGVSVLDDRTGAPCLLPELKAAYSRPRLVHRLDKGTSGVMLVALDRPTQQDLNRAFNARAVRKHYVGVICGHFPSGRTLTIDLPLKQGRKSRYRVAGLREEIRPTRAGWTIDADGGHASKTRVRTIARGEKRTVVAIQPITGRSHQIRVHLSWIGHAVAGDHLYGSPTSIEQASPRLALHCHRVFAPGYGTFSAPVPEDVLGAVR